ncbi:putative Zinc finger protein DZIP1L [Hypsibius exemplaris]|uniref:Zinc finger protein DZIP1L n=1 Tax=Hypsibius exemplaris TaxID=2072580 RepID=A0A1W0WMR8_HYPEX|nr:putative Zinc finger protein DZIP1L [Hypsibius exemplaris]
MDSNRLSGPRTFGVISTKGGINQHQQPHQRSQSSRPLGRGKDCYDEQPSGFSHQMPTYVGSLDRLPIASRSVHTVPLRMSVPNPATPTGMPPGRLEQPASNAFSMIFRKKYERLDWRKLAAIDLERIYKTQDTTTLQENLTQMAFFDLEEELRSVDIKPQFTKLFQLMQLSLEYLLYVQDHLEREAASTRASYTTAVRQQEQEVGRLNDELEQLKGSLQASRDELRKRKRMMIAQQEIINSAAKGNYHRCPLCEKAFIERGYLETHFRKRHPTGDWFLLRESGGLGGSDKNELDSARDKIRELEALLTNGGHPSCPTCGSPGPCSVHAATPDVPPQVLDLYNKQREDLETLRRALTDVQSRYGDSEKTLADLRRDYDSLSGKALDSPKEVAEVMERRVAKLQETFESRMGRSEDSWKDRFTEAAEQHKRDLKDMEREMGLRASEQQMSHKAEKLQLQMANEELLRRIRDLEGMLQGSSHPQPRPRKDPTFQVKVQTNRPGATSVTPAARRTNRWGQHLTPRVSAAVSVHPNMINDLRSELADALEKKLEEYGIPPGCTKVSDSEKDHVFQRLREEHGRLQGKLAKFTAARSTIENHMKTRLPAQYSSSDLLDEANKIRVRTRTGRQFTENGPGGSQRVTEVTTYDIRPARASEMDLAKTAAPEEPRPKTAPGSRRVTFERNEEGSDHSGPSRTTRADISASSDDTHESLERASPTLRDSAQQRPPSAKKQDDGAWFTDESEG